MPSLEAHLAAVETNLAAYDAFPNEFPGWKAVTLFYTAVHLVEAYFAIQSKRGLHHTEHTNREIAVRKDLRNIWPQYLRLKNESLKARYLALRDLGGTDKVKKTLFSMTDEQVFEQLRKKCIRKIHGVVNEKLVEAGFEVVEVS